MSTLGGFLLKTSQSHQLNIQSKLKTSLGCLELTEEKDLPFYLVQGKRDVYPQDLLSSKPFLSREQRFIVASDSRFDNRKYLYGQLKISDLALDQCSNDRLIYEAFLKWGTSCFEQFLGSFLIVIWDRLKKELVLSRDPFGTRSMYYFNSSELFAFCGTARGLWSFSGINRSLNLVKVVDFLLFNWLDTEQSFYKGISRLEPGHYLKVDQQQVVKKRYYYPSFKKIYYSNKSDYYHHFRDIVVEAVKCRIPPNSVVGSLNSGGLDSGSVSCLAARILQEQGRRLPTFTAIHRDAESAFLSGSESRFDAELPFVYAINSAYPNLDSRCVVTRGSCLIEELDQLFPTFDASVRNPLNIVWYKKALEQARENGVKILLVGDHGNFTFTFSMIHYLKHLIQRGQLRHAMQVILGFTREKKGLRKKAYAVETGFLGLLPNSFHQLYLKVRRRGNAVSWKQRGMLNASVFETFYPLGRFEELGFNPLGGHEDPDKAREEVLFRSSTVDGKECFDNYRLDYGISVEDPSLDRRVVEYCFSLPYETFDDGMHNRLLLKKTLSDCVPSKVLMRKDRGEQASDWYQQMQDSLPAMKQCVADFYHYPEIKQLLDVKAMDDLLSKGLQKNQIYRHHLPRGIAMGRFMQGCLDNS